MGVVNVDDVLIEVKLVDLVGAVKPTGGEGWVHVGYPLLVDTDEESLHKTACPATCFDLCVYSR